MTSSCHEKSPRPGVGAFGPGTASGSYMPINAPCGSAITAQLPTFGTSRGPPRTSPPSWLSYICVDDVDAAASEVKQAGGKVILGPMEVPGGDRVLQGVDPQGAWFALHTIAKP